MPAKIYDCVRCSGLGHIPGFGHVVGGVCFKCAGSGKQEGKPRKSLTYPIEFRDVAAGTWVSVFGIRAASPGAAVKLACVQVARASEEFRAKYDTSNPRALAPCD